MSMPSDLILVRHGQSEANIVQGMRKTDPSAEAPEGFHDRHDSRMRLSKDGVNQAEITGRWLLDAFPEGFDRYYASALTRTVETAGRLAIDGKWKIDDRWRERDWGEYGVLSDEQQQGLYQLTTKLKTQSKWYWCPPGGESLASGVRLRLEDILDTLHRELDGKKVLAVTHGETMEVARFILERLLPEEWEAQEKSASYKLSNCQILHYSRKDPNTGKLGNRLSWRRSICAWDETKSWNAGDWVKLKNRTFSDKDLTEMVEQHDRLFSSDQ